MRSDTDLSLSFYPHVARGLSLLVAIALAIAALSIVPLVPQVGTHLFFGPDDPQMSADREIQRRFGASSYLLLAVEGDLASKHYQQAIAELTAEIAALPGTQSVQSLAHGPSDLEDAYESPLWRSLLLSEGRASRIVVALDDESNYSAVQRIIEAGKDLQRQGFPVHISGIPYLIERIESLLLDDIITFTCVSAVVLLAFVLVLFRSLVIVVGVVTSCLAAVSVTMLSIHALGVQIGVLTANLLSIVFVLSASHMTFLIFAAASLDHPTLSSGAIARAAIRRTLHPAFWAMATTSIGFGTYLFAPAKPLQEFGASGCIASVVSMACAFTFFAPFLGPHAGKVQRIGGDWMGKVVQSHVATSVTLVLFGVALLLTPYLPRLNTDPSLLEYFDREGPIYEGLQYLDRDGGSTPLLIAIRDPSGSGFDSRHTFSQVQELHRALDFHPAVGSLVSFPLLASEVQRSFLGSILPLQILVAFADLHPQGEVLKRFLSEEADSSLLYLRMREQTGAQARAETIREIEQEVRRFGFIPEQVGGVFVLAQRMGVLLRQSLTSSLMWSAPIFFLVAFLLSRSVLIAAAIMLSLSLAPLLLLGTAGYLETPLDLATIPSATLAMALGVDAMFHLVHERRLNEARRSWSEESAHLSTPILISVGTLVVGFSVLLFSHFPPSRRFGLFIVAGVVIAGLSALVVLPRVAALVEQLLLRKGWKRVVREPSHRAQLWRGR